MKRLAEHSIPVATGELFETLARPWTLHILWALSTGGPMRFGTLRRKVGKVSARVLTARLRGLEAKNFVYRHYKQTIPPEVTYGLTKRFEEIGTVFKQLDRLVRKWEA
jgi:DNA-binding HxlR family transcriptional regulator